MPQVEAPFFSLEKETSFRECLQGTQFEHIHLRLEVQVKEQRKRGTEKKTVCV